ncbi:DUF6234 family protein [Streptomyces coryli]|uniref:DUF6234 family protein n=1 Tax=Streptomyces coryli TaxID=1128680 RepID=UPI003B8319C5
MVGEAGLACVAGPVLVMALAAAVLAARGDAVTTMCSQGLVALVVAGGIFVGMTDQDASGPHRPSPGSTFSGEVGCRSGGDNRECLDTGG